ncbi:hypothetical protein Q1695_004886 [Nippostrongylus brasiliensis]|nr:hypothetical protein Q1695_004886 [Nippostrongylus brasiliensis]
MTVLTQLKQKKDHRNVHVPVPKLPTVDEVRKAIPPHCFEKNLVTSIRYLIQDYVLLAALYMVVPYAEQYLGVVGYLAWLWVFGIVACALFVVGHDCGHGTFSEYEWVNDICGHLAHAPLMAPYWPWQKSHRQHHQYTSHVEKDRGHPWITEDHYVQRPWYERWFAAFPLSGWIRWNPVYTIIGKPDGSHFWPWSRLFTTTEDRVKCVVSGVACVICSLVALHMVDYSAYNWVKYYYIPLLFQGLILVIITYLQHTDDEIEVYEHDEWTFVRGQTQTIDRTYGLGIDYIMHNITDGHVAHHFFFTKIPHYHLLEATDAVKKILEPLKGTPYEYKSKTNYDFFFRYLQQNFRLDYLTYKSKGVMQYRVGLEAQQNKAK